jgi:hypothetical protein
MPSDNGDLESMVLRGNGAMKGKPKAIWAAVTGEGLRWF